MSRPVKAFVRGEKMLSYLSHVSTQNILRIPTERQEATSTFFVERSELEEGGGDSVSNATGFAKLVNQTNKQTKAKTNNTNYI